MYITFQMAIQIINIVFIVALTNLWIYAEPLIYLKRFLGFKEENYETYVKYKRMIHRAAYCAYCSSFYIALVIFPVIGYIPLVIKFIIISTLVMYIVDGLMNR